MARTALGPLSAALGPLTAALAAATIGGGAAHAACPADLAVSLGTAASISYTPGGGAETREISVDLTGGAAVGDCEIHAFAAAPRRMTQTGGAGLLTYEISTPADAALAEEQPPLPDSLLALVTPGDGLDATAKLTIAVAAAQFPPSGAYSDNLAVSFYKKNAPNDFTLVASKSLSLTATVAQVATLALGGVIGGNQTLDYPVMTENAERTVQVTAVSNDGFRFTAYSINQGVMRHDGDATARGAVSYTATLGPETLLLSGASQAAPYRSTAILSSTDPGGLEQTLVFRLGSVDGKRAGDYADTIFIQIEPATTP